MAENGHNVGVEQSAKELMRIRQCESTTQATWGGGHLSIDKEFNRISLIINGLILTEVPWFHATPIAIYWRASMEAEKEANICE